MTATAHGEPTASENAARVAARGFVIAGGAFWVVAAFMGPYAFHDTSFAESLGAALWPFLATVIAYVVGSWNERIASALLFAGAGVLFLYGILSGWEFGVWILAGIVLFAPILIAAVLFLFAARAEGRRAAGAGAAPPPSAKPRRPALKTWLAGAAIGVVGFAVAVPVYYTATPSQCASCHEMEAYYESWSDSAHREFTESCLDCHVEPGFMNLVRYEVEFYGEVVGHFAGADVKMAGVSTPGLQSCQRADCHALDEEPYSEFVLIEHQAHVDQEHLECPDCHSGVVHEGVAGRSVIPPMEQCRDCHEDEMSFCTYCHEDGPPQPVAPETH